MAISFPSSPTNGQTYTVGAITWTWNSATNAWRGVGGAVDNLAGGSAGTLPYQSAANTTAMLGAGTSGQLLSSSGTAAPSWLAQSSLTVAQSQVTNLTTALAGKAASSHTHATSDVTGLQTALDAKAPLAGATFTGNVSVVSPTATGSTGVRQATMSTADPSGGSDGDVWLKYTP